MLGMTLNKQHQPTPHAAGLTINETGCVEGQGIRPALSGVSHITRPPGGCWYAQVKRLQQLAAWVRDKHVPTRSDVLGAVLKAHNQQLPAVLH